MRCKTPFSEMLEINYIRENRQTVIKGLKKKYFEEPESAIDEVLRLDDLRKSLQSEADSALSEGNKTAKAIGALMKAGQREEAEVLKAKSAEFKAKTKDFTEKHRETVEILSRALYEIPNIPSERVPEGRRPEENEVLLEKGAVPQLSVDAKPHWELIKDYDIIDFEAGVKITGAGFPVYKGQGARLQRALISFFLDEAAAAGYTEIMPPLLVNEASGFGTCNLPDKEGEMYRTVEEGLYLIPTAEVPITNLYREVILDEKDLPIKNAGHTACFRREAGSWGAHVRGLNRLHQFEKVEIVQITKPENSDRAHEEMSAYIQKLLQKLELPYRVLVLCGGDISFNAALCYDMEVFSAAQQKWLEVSSVSNFGTFQTNRLKLRYRAGNNKKILLHSLNGSALALPRIVAAILENNQETDGIRIPEVLRKYTGFDRITK